MARQEKSDSWFDGRNFWSSMSSTMFDLFCLLSILAAHSPTVNSVEGDSGSSVTKWSDVCKWDTFSAECPSDSVILVDHAFYGRMRLGTCLTVSYGHIGCSADVRSIVERRCSGRRQCSVQVPDVELDKSAHNCPPDLGAYLEIGFHCQPVITGSDQNCSSSNPLSIPSNGGVLASIVTMETGRGSISCPWVIKTTAGQTLTVTLLDFTGTSTAANSSTGTQNVQATATGDTYVDVGHVCVIYAEIKERIGGGGGEGTAAEQLRRVALVCGGERRTKVVYTSTVTTNSELFVNVYATSAAATVNNPTYFLIKFEVGCVEYVSTNAALSVVRSTPGQSIQVQCVGDNRTRWDVTCVDGRWTPDMSGTDCSRPLHTALLDSAAGGATSGQLTANQGVLIIIVIGTALLLSIIIIVAGIVYLRRKSRYEVGAVTDVVDPYGKYAFPADASSVYAFGHTGCGGVGGGAQREFYPAMLASHERLSVGERDYATTLQMRQTATPTPPCPLDDQPHHIQALWTCPVHGHVVRLIQGAVPPPPPRCVAGFDGGRIYETTARLEQAPAEASSGSPFYHELDPSAVVMTTDRTRRAAAAATSVGNGANCAAADDDDSTPKQPPDSSR